ncbi:MAG: phospholipase A [Shewanella sp.]|nr:phospholipase A [Shewanella sp.]MCF1431457.1 phospholipase A [Shewanella sp.]MCF1457203.1 phospholipase A [Shewanella sp.]
MPKMNILAVVLGCTQATFAVHANEQQFSQQYSPQDEQFHLSAYDDNYLLPWYYTTQPNQQYYAPQNPNGGEISKTNFQFQISLKYGLLANVFTQNDGLYFAYSQIANWQAYDTSAFFRDTQYQPDLFWVFQHGDNSLDWQWRHTSIGFMHQSNGKGGKYERAWNRFYLDLQFGGDDLRVNVRPWIRSTILNSHDYNPNIEDFMGYGDIQLAWTSGNHQIKLTLRNQLESSFSAGYEELSWQFPIYKQMHGYLKLQSGYGLTISDYNHYDNAVGIGIAL